MQTFSPTFSTPTVYQFSTVMVSKKDNSNMCIALLATDNSTEQSIIQDKQHRINQQNKNPS
jgi:hypothetical protein